METPDPLHAGVFRGDCRGLMDTLPEKSIRLVLTDPPYAVAAVNNFDTMGRTSIDFPWDDYELDLPSWVSRCARVLMPGGSIVVMYDIWKLQELRSVLEEHGFEIKGVVYLYKTNPWPRNRDRTSVGRVEHGVWAVRKPTKGWVFNRRPEAKYEDMVFELEPEDGVERPLVFKCGVPRMPKELPRHEALKPLSMFRELVQILSNPGDHVLDPFAGQGTTQVAAELEGRIGISMEIDEGWHEESLRRWLEARSAT